jgi:hypothetical protein
MPTCGGEAKSRITARQTVGENPKSLLKYWGMSREAILGHMARRERRASPLWGCKERATPPDGPRWPRPEGCAAFWAVLRCSSVADPRGVCSLVAPCNSPKIDATRHTPIFQQALREPLIKWEGHLLEAIGPFFKARAKRQYPQRSCPSEQRGKTAQALPALSGCTEKRPGAALAPQSQPMRDAPASPPCPRPLLSATNAPPI